MVKKRPESAQAHFTLAYVLRYVGLLDKSAQECETALALDRGNYYFRSCAWVFMEVANTQRARDFIQLDAGSEWATYAMPFLLLREGKVAEAREAVKKMSTNPQDFRYLLQACLVGPSAELERLVRVAETATSAARKFTPLICSFRDALQSPGTDPDIPILKQAKAEYAKLQ